MKKNLFPFLFGLFVLLFFSSLSSVHAQSCSDECSPTGKINCLSDGINYRTCGTGRPTYDDDSCLEWQINPLSTSCSGVCAQEGCHPASCTGGNFCNKAIGSYQCSSQNLQQCQSDFNCCQVDPTYGGLCQSWKNIFTCAEGTSCDLPSQSCVPLSCSSDAECSSSTCDLRTHTCVSLPPCTPGSSCPGGSVCPSSGVCPQECTSGTTSCPLGALCPSSGYCSPSPPGIPCTSTRACPHGETCLETGICSPPCNPGTTSCTSDTLCPSSGYCDPPTPTPCTVGVTKCPGGKTCTTGSCPLPCIPGTYTCAGGTFCPYPSTTGSSSRSYSAPTVGYCPDLSASTPCTSGSICLGGAPCPVSGNCPIRCQAGTTCPGGDACPLIGPSALVCPVTCEPGMNTCAGATACPTNGYCPAIPPVATCKSGGCPPPCFPGTNTCPGNKPCPSFGTCPPYDVIPSCTSGDTCPGGSACPSSGLCPSPCVPGTISCLGEVLCPSTGPSIGYCPPPPAPPPTPCIPNTLSCPGSVSCPASGNCPVSCIPGTTSCPLGAFCASNWYCSTSSSTPPPAPPPPPSETPPPSSSPSVFITPDQTLEQLTCPVEEDTADTDGDGSICDLCPDLASGPLGKNGCPLAPAPNQDQIQPTTTIGENQYPIDSCTGLGGLVCSENEQCSNSEPVAISRTKNCCVPKKGQTAACLQNQISTVRGSAIKISKSDCIDPSGRGSGTRTVTFDPALDSSSLEQAGGIASVLPECASASCAANEDGSWKVTCTTLPAGGDNVFVPAYTWISVILTSSLLLCFYFFKKRKL